MTEEKAREVRAPIVIRGIGVGRGVAIGPLRFGEMRGGEDELFRLEGALSVARGEISTMLDRAVKSVGEEHGEIYRIHLSLLDDEMLMSFIKGQIEKGDSLYAALAQVKERFSCKEGDDRAQRARCAHIKEVADILISAAESAPNEKSERVDGGSIKEGEKYILVSHASERGFLKGPDGADDIIGIVCVGGSENSGLAAYARAKGLPALVIQSAEALSSDLSGSGAIIDALRGRLTVNPDLAALDRFTESVRENEEEEKRLSSLIGMPSVTRSGRHVSLFGSIGSLRDAELALSSDAEGIGIFKTESVFDETEENQYDAYKKLIAVFGGKPIYVRAFAGGLGSDMGLRGVRYCLSKREAFKAQLRALLRASASGPISLAVPMVVSAEEIRRVRAVMIECVSELRSAGIEFGEKVRLGVMIDTPASAIIGDALAPEADFFIADTDSLSRLALAADRRDGTVSDILRKNPDPVLRLVGDASRAIHSSGKGKQMGVLGDLAADLSLTERFLALGVDFLSVSPPYVLELRERIRECP